MVFLSIFIYYYISMSVLFSPIEKLSNWLQCHTFPFSVDVILFLIVECIISCRNWPKYEALHTGQLIRTCSDKDGSVGEHQHKMSVNRSSAWNVCWLYDRVNDNGQCWLQTKFNGMRVCFNKYIARLRVTNYQGKCIFMCLPNGTSPCTDFYCLFKWQCTKFTL